MIKTFTGIIEEIGTIRSVRHGMRSAELTIGGDIIFDDIKLGDSVAVSGVCLTVTNIKGKTFTADVMSETLRRSSLSAVRSGSRVNLERAVPVGGRLGGHIVSGHVDGLGTIIGIKRDDNAIVYTIRADAKLLRYIAEKGSVALDGISLTVTEVRETVFGVSVIPHTAENTTLSLRRTGDKINIETDCIAKYVEKMLTTQQRSD